MRIFDITDIDHPKYLANVQTCRGSHTHTVVHDPNDNEQRLHLYLRHVGGASGRGARRAASATANDPNTALFRIEVIKVPLAHPEQAAIVSSPRIFAGRERRRRDGDSSTRMRARSVAGGCRAPARVAAAVRGGRWRGGRGGRGADVDGGRPARYNYKQARGTGPDADDASLDSADCARCEPTRPTRLSRRLQVRAAYPPPPRRHADAVPRHHGLSGGRSRRRCVRRHGSVARHSRRRRIRAASPRSPTPTSRSGTRRRSATTARWCCSRTSGAAAARRTAARRIRRTGAPTRSSRSSNGQMVFQNYYKMPAPQTQLENCVAHNGSLIPIPGRTIMVQAWYQGGLSIFEWTDPAHPHEIGVLRPRPERFDARDGRRLLVGVLVQRPHHRLRDAARSRHLRAHAERRDLAERDRCGEVGAVRLPQRAGSAEVRLAGVVRAVAGIHRSARALARSVGRQGLGGAHGAVERRRNVRRGAARRA